MLRNRLVIEWLAVALFGVLVATLTAWFGLTTKLDNLLLDVAAPLQVAPPDDRILIVEIDNETLKKVGNFPWARGVHATFLNQLKSAKPKVVGYDILFLEPMDAAQDTALAEAIGRGAPTFLPVLFQVPGINGAPETLTLPIAPLSKAAAGLGEVNLLFDTDGLVRRAQLQTNAAGREVPHLMELTYQRVTGRVSAALGRVRANRLSEESLYVPMAHVGSFRRVSFAGVLNGEVPASFLKDKIVLVGATADGMGDRYPVSPMAGSSMAGIEIQANLLNALFADRFILPVGPNAAALFSGLPVLLLMLLFWRFMPTANLLLSVIILAVIFCLSLVLIDFYGLWFSPVSAMLGVVIAYPLWGWRRLAALTGFVTKQAQVLGASSYDKSRVRPTHARLDSVGRQASDLAWVIAETHDRKAFMADVIAGLPEAICVLDGEGNIVLSNIVAASLFGDDMDGATMKEALLKVGAGVLMDGQEAVLPDGRSFILRQVGFADRAGAIAVFVDTTALRKLGREREEMLEFLSHDMRAPQSAILMLLRSDTPLDAAVRDHIAASANQTLRLADNFVQLARLNAIELDLEDVDLAAIASESIDSCWPQAKAKGIKIAASGLDREAFIRGDAGALMRALSNLIDNAVKYSPDGSEVRCALSVAARQVKIVVADTGPGLPPNRAKDVFARFGDRGKTDIGGSGLGLAFVRTSVRRHGGDVVCDSEAGVGTRFTLTFPMDDQR